MENKKSGTVLLAERAFERATRKADAKYKAVRDSGASEGALRAAREAHSRAWAMAKSKMINALEGR